MLMVQNFEILLDILLIILRFRILKVLSNKLLTCLRGQNFLRLYPKNYEQAHDREFWGFIRKITNTLKAQNF